MEMTEHNTIELGCTDDEMEILNKTFVVTITNNEYKMLVTKAAALDIITANIKAAGNVNEDVVMAATGTSETASVVPKEEADNYWRYYMEEKKKTDELKNKVAELDRARKDLIEILRQNKIGPYAEKKDQEGND